MSRIDYRVDRAREGAFAPAGMNSLLYLGGSMEDALAVFRQIDGGKDAWNNPDPTYGVMLSVWHPERRDYIVKRWKNK